MQWRVINWSFGIFHAYISPQFDHILILLSYYEFCAFGIGLFFFDFVGIFDLKECAKLFLSQ